MQDKISFYDQISRNKRNSFFLMFIIIVIIIALGYVIGLIYHEYFFFILILAIIISILYVLVGYYNSDKIALASVKAKPANEAEYRQLHNSVEGLCIASGMPKPKIYIMENKQINAFATGRNPQNSVICVTTGAVEKLNKQELEGVLAHELSHVANYDIRFMTLAAVLIGLIAIISQMFLRSLWIGGGKNKEKAAVIIILIGIVLAILAPIFANLAQLAISRKREYMADASAVKFTRYPKGLVSALKKIKQEHPNQEDKRKINKAVAPLFISDPFKKKMSGLFQTHPPLDKRISMLENM